MGTIQENAIKWIDVLLSGEYKQTRNRLGDLENGFCCWGLGCYLMGLEFRPGDQWNNYLSREIGFKSLYGGIRTEEDKQICDLANLNDDMGYPFEEIAKVLIDNCDLAFIPEVAEAIKQKYGTESKS